MFHSFFLKRTCFDLLGTGRFSCTLRVTDVTANNGFAPVYHDLRLDLVGLIVNFETAAQLVLLLAEQLLNPIPSSNHVSRKSLEEDEVTHIYFFRISLLQFPSEQLSGYNKLGVFREEWWRSIVSDRTSILSFEQY